MEQVRREVRAVRASFGSRDEVGLFGSLHRPSAYDADGAAEPLLAAEAAAPATAAGGGSRSPRTMWRAAARAAAAQRGLSQLVPPRGGGGAPAPASPRAERRRVRAAAIAEAFLFSLWPRPALAAAPSAPGSPGAAPSSPRSPGARACARAAAFAPATDARALAAMLRSSYLNVLLLAAPATFAAEAAGLPPTAVFCLSLAAIVPLALVLGEVTEDLALHYGDAVGGLLNATFGNVVELILAVAALRRGLFAVVAASLVGSILSNLLLVLGCAFLFGGLANHRQRFSSSANKVLCSLLMVACLCFSLPSVSRAVYGLEAMPPPALALLSRVIALALIGLYGLYLYFQLISHPELFAAENGGAGGEEEAEWEGGGVLAMERGGGRRGGSAGGGSGSASPRRPRRTSSVTLPPPRPAHEQPALSTSGALAALLAVTLVVAACSEALTGALEPVVAATGIPAAFIGLVVLPIAGNAAEHATAVFVAIKDKMDLALGVALGSCLQIAIFVLPACVLAGWAMGSVDAAGDPFALDLDPFLVLTLTLSVVLAYFVTADGRSNWLLGLELVVAYCLIGLVFLVKKEPGGGGGGGKAPAAALLL